MKPVSDLSRVDYLHQIVFLDEYSPEEIKEHLSAFGYQSMADLEQKNFDANELLVAIIADNTQGREMPIETATEYAKKIVGPTFG